MLDQIHTGDGYTVVSQVVPLFVFLFSSKSKLSYQGACASCLSCVLITIWQEGLLDH